MANCPPRNQCHASPSKPEPESKEPPPKFESPPIMDNPLAKIGPKQIAAAKGFIPSLIVWSIFGAIATVYFTDWRVITNYIPFYRGKYAEEKPKKKKKSSAESGEAASAGAAEDAAGGSEEKKEE